MARYFMVVRDYQSAQRPHIMHGYKAGQVLRGEIYEGGTVYLSGPTTAEKVFGSLPCEQCLSESYSQSLKLEDVVEVTKVNQRQLKVGDKIVFDADTPSNVANGPKAGEVCYVDEVDFDDPTPLHLTGEFNEYGLWFEDRVLNKVGIFLFPREGEESVDKVDTPVYTDKPSEDKEETPVTPRVKPIYEVQLRDGTSVFRTKDRDDARRLKAALGGKANGVVIIQYNAIKEIR